MAIVRMTGTLHERAGSVEYIMPQAYAAQLLKERKGTDKNMNPQQYLVKYVNEECGLLYKCVSVTTK